MNTCATRVAHFLVTSIDIFFCSFPFGMIFFKRITKMKDIFAKRSRDAFVSVLGDFLRSIEEHFPQCPVTKKWIAWHDSLADDSSCDYTECTQEWLDAMNNPLEKKCAKYAKAVASITKNPACVYHAMAYRDLQAVEVSSQYFSQLNLLAKTKELRKPDVDIFWQYVDELNKNAYEGMRLSRPEVPSPEDIRENIQRRKGSSPSGPVLTSGMDDLWSKLCEKRKVTCTETIESVSKKLNELSLLDQNGKSMAELVKTRDVNAYEKIFCVFPYLKKGETFLDEEWDIFEKCMSMATMQSNIPTNMMQGIETVANDLISGLNKGTVDLSKLNVEEIGQRVLSGVSQEEMNEFARNMDKILPAMQKM